MSETHESISTLLTRSDAGDPAASAELMQLVYSELRALAGACARCQDAGHTWTWIW